MYHKHMIARRTILFINASRMCLAKKYMIISQTFSPTDFALFRTLQKSNGRKNDEKNYNNLWKFKQHSVIILFLQLAPGH